MPAMLLTESSCSVGHMVVLCDWAGSLGNGDVSTLGAGATADPATVTSYFICPSDVTFSTSFHLRSTLCSIPWFVQMCCNFTIEVDDMAIS